MDAWDVAPGMEVVVEPDDAPTCLTARVLDADVHALKIDLGPCTLPDDAFIALVSIFTPASFWRFPAKVEDASDVSAEPGRALRTLIPTTTPERIERRAARRLRTELAAYLGDGRDTRATRVAGHTVDLSSSGVRVRTDGPMIGDGSWVTVVLPDGSEVTCQSEVVESLRTD